MPADRDELLAAKGSTAAARSATPPAGSAALARSPPSTRHDLPTRAPRGDGPPLPRAWADRDPVAARRLTLAREALGALAEEHDLPVENLLTPDYLRRVLWTPPATRDPASLAAAVAAALSALGARAWQVELVGPAVTRAILDGEAAETGTRVRAKDHRDPLIASPTNRSRGTDPPTSRQQVSRSRPRWATPSPPPPARAPSARRRRSPG